MTPLFVYGTLKRGGGNHSHLAGQVFAGVARTVPGYCLYELCGYPGLVKEPEAREGVLGELWLVDAPTLARIDELEGTSVRLYLRAGIELDEPHQAREVQTYYYLRSLEGRRRVGSVWEARGSQAC